MRSLLALVLAFEPAPADTPPDPPPDAEPGRTDAATLFQLGLYREAAEAFAREYAANPDPALLFGRAVALKRSGDCMSAIDAFEVFIAAGPPASDVEEAQGQIEQCRDIVAATAAASPAPRAPPPASEVVPPSPTPHDDRSRVRPWYRDPVGGALVGVGAPVLLTGIGLFAGSFVLADQPQPDAQSEHEDRSARVRALAASGLPLMAVGAALAIAGAIRWGLVARKQRRAANTASLPTTGLRFRF